MKSATLLYLVMWTGWILPASRSQSNFPELTQDKINQARNTIYDEVLAKRLANGINDNDCEEGKMETMLHQMWLYTNYRGAFEYRLERHNYAHLDKEDKPDHRNYSGSVVLLNFQNTRMKLECPCASGESVDNWKMYGKGSKEFNEDQKAVTKKMLTTKAPTQRLYYRTFSCTVGTFTHYFNVFTRPLGLTSVPPLMFTEGISGPADSVKEVTCSLTMYRNLKHQPPKFVIIQAPFQFYWQFPGKEPGQPLTAEQQDVDSERKTENRPPAESSTRDNVYWTLERKSSHPPAVNDISYFELVPDGQPVPPGDICLEPDPGTHPNVKLSSTLKVSGDWAQKEHAGFYACIVEDRNGLSSAYWWDGDDPPVVRFRGFTHIRVRGKQWVYIAIGCFLGLGIILVLMIFFLPDNKEDFTEDADTKEGPPPPPVEVEEPEVKASDRVSITPSHKPEPEPSILGRLVSKASRADQLQAVESAELVMDRQGQNVKGGMLKGIASKPAESTKSVPRPNKKTRNESIRKK